ncbi:MAG: hypothetical protein COT74_06985 [Bdellovibrionales bacterium CG10_big_fil_rev_8_21_14_0_10_45_34]|nr:MAG: hypothetical protein COT74_06985 [Bdellovibrionales bacterium CG10_big_fil_rev_8_21_14_0_10_45_34]
MNNTDQNEPPSALLKFQSKFMSQVCLRDKNAVSIAGLGASVGSSKHSAARKDFSKVLEMTKSEQEVIGLRVYRNSIRRVFSKTLPERFPVFSKVFSQDRLKELTVEFGYQQASRAWRIDGVRDDFVKWAQTEKSGSSVDEREILLIERSLDRILTLGCVMKRFVLAEEQVISLPLESAICVSAKNIDAFQNNLPDKKLFLTDAFVAQVSLDATRAEEPAIGPDKLNSSTFPSANVHFAEAGLSEVSLNEPIWLFPYDYEGQAYFLKVSRGGAQLLEVLKNYQSLQDWLDSFESESQIDTVSSKADCHSGYIDEVISALKKELPCWMRACAVTIAGP